MIILFNSFPVTIRSVHEGEAHKTKKPPDDTVTKIMTEQWFTKELALVARTVLSRLSSEASVIVVTHAKSIVHLYAFIQFEQDFLCRIAGDVIDVYQKGSLYVMIAKMSNSVKALAKHQRIPTKSPSRSDTIHIEIHEYSFYPPPSTPMDSNNVFQYKADLNGLQQMNGQETV